MHTGSACWLAVLVAFAISQDAATQEEENQIENAIDQVKKHAETMKDQVDNDKDLSDDEKQSRKDAIDEALDAALAALSETGPATKSNAQEIRRAYVDMMNIVRYGFAPSGDCTINIEIVGSGQVAGAIREISKDVWQGSPIKVTITAGCAGSKSMSVGFVNDGTFSSDQGQVKIPGNVGADVSAPKNSWNSSFFVDATKSSVCTIIALQFKVECKKPDHQCRAVAIIHLGNGRR